MTQVKKIPYGLARFEQVRSENAYYVDKTSYLPLLEDTSNYLFLIRPRRFGKSVFVTIRRIMTSPRPTASTPCSTGCGYSSTPRR